MVYILRTNALKVMILQENQIFVTYKKKLSLLR